MMRMLMRINILNKHTAAFGFLVPMQRSLFILLLITPGILFTQSVNSLKGRVVSADDGSPIVGASVMVKNTTLGVSTGTDGSFSITNVPAARRVISVSAIGYKSVSYTLNDDLSQNLIIELPTSPVQTQTVVVTASKRPQSLEEIPVSMNVLEARSIEERNSISLDEALRYIPGVNFQQSQINIRASSGYSRGVGSRILMLVDGVPLLTGDTKEITFESIPVFHIDRVEVVKGAGSALYGSGALGGVINVLTKEIGEETELWWRTYGGMYSDPQYDEWNWSGKTRYVNGQSAGISMKESGLGITASLQRLSDDGYREQDWLRRYNGFVKLTYDISPYQSMTATSNYFQQYRGDFLWWKDLKNALIPADAQRNVTTSSLRFNTGVQYKHFINDKFFYAVHASHFRGNWHRDSATGVRLDGSVSDAFVSEIQGNLSLTERNILTFGIVGSFEDVDSDIFGIHDGNGAALYVQNEYVLSSDLSVSAGIRHDAQQISGGSTHQQTNPKFGIRYSVDEYHTIRASAGRGFRAPSIGEYYTSTANTGSAAIIIPSPNLKPEVSATYEISGTNILSSDARFEWALFHSDFYDLIEPNVQSDTVLKAVTVNFKNITQARIQGFELSMFTHALDRSLSIDGHYNYNWAINTVSNTFLRFRPRHIAGINTLYRFPPVSIGLDYRYVSRIETIDETLVELAPIKNGSRRVPIHVVDARLLSDLAISGYPLRCSFNVKNIFGYNYNELIGNVSPPRSYVLTFEGIIK